VERGGQGLAARKGIPFIAVAHEGGMANADLAVWTGVANAPVAMLDDERPRAHWSEILMMAERLAPTPRLVPADEVERALVMGLAHAICGEDGLGWNRRIQLLDQSEASARAKAAEKDPSALHRPNAPIAAMRRRYSPNGDPAAAEARILSILRHLEEVLAANQQAGSHWFVGKTMTAVDIYWAAFAMMFDPLPEAWCPMPRFYRDGALVRSAAIIRALTPALLAHRDGVAAECFEKPMRF